MVPFSVCLSWFACFCLHAFFLNIVRPRNIGHAGKQYADDNDGDQNAGMGYVLVVSTKEASTGHVLGIGDFSYDPLVDVVLDRQNVVWSGNIGKFFVSHKIVVLLLCR